jgi:hypothetical protein
MVVNWLLSKEVHMLAMEIVPAFTFILFFLYIDCSIFFLNMATCGLPAK